MSIILVLELFLDYYKSRHQKHYILNVLYSLFKHQMCGKRFLVLMAVTFSFYENVKQFFLTRIYKYQLQLLFTSQGRCDQFKTHIFFSLKLYILTRVYFIN